MDKLYFIDHSEDAVLPCVGDKDLVNRYNNVLGIYETKEELYIAVSEFAEYARGGVKSLKEYTRDELIKKVNDNEYKI